MERAVVSGWRTLRCGNKARKEGTYEGSSLLFGGRKARYTPLAHTDDGTGSECRIVLAGDYHSGVSTVRSELIRIADNNNHGGDATSVESDGCVEIRVRGHAMKLWMALSPSELEQLMREEMHCCVICFSTAERNACRDVEGKWLPQLSGCGAQTPIVLCRVYGSDDSFVECSFWPHDVSPYFCSDVCFGDEESIESLCMNLIHLREKTRKESIVQARSMISQTM